MRIQSDKIYTLKQLYEMRAFKSVNSYNTYKSLVWEDRATENILQAEIEGVGVRRTYRIKGSNVQAFVKKLSRTS